MIEGECFCGAIRYRIKGVLQHARSCHCSRCRKLFGAAASAFAEITDSGQFAWTRGEDKVRRHGTDKGWAYEFCQDCGSPLCGLHRGKVIGVMLGCVDGDPGIELEKHIFVGSKAPWDHIGGSVPQYEEWES